VVANVTPIAGQHFLTIFSYKYNALFASPPTSHTIKMVDAMESIITIDNFTAKMSTFDLNHAGNQLYGLVDMGR
jgi:hypothetical protein